jgi:hypothetical protein
LTHKRVLAAAAAGCLVLLVVGGVADSAAAASQSPTAACTLDVPRSIGETGDSLRVTVEAKNCGSVRGELFGRDPRTQSAWHSFQVLTHQGSRQGTVFNFTNFDACSDFYVKFTSDGASAKSPTLDRSYARRTAAYCGS